MKPWSFESKQQFPGIGSGLRSSYSFSFFPISSQSSALVILEPFLVLRHPGHIPDICAYCCLAGNVLPPMAPRLLSYGPRPTCHLEMASRPTHLSFHFIVEYIIILCMYFCVFIVSTAISSLWWQEPWKICSLLLLQNLEQAQYKLALRNICGINECWVESCEDTLISV